MRTLVLALVALTACNGGDPNDTSGTTGDGGSDGGAGTTTGQGTVTMTALMLGTAVSVDITLVGEQTYTAKSGTDITVATPDAYTASAGDPVYTDQFGFPVHVDATGEYWAAAPQDIDIDDGEKVTKEFILFNLFEPGVYSCSYDKYVFDGAAPDKKGEYQRTVDLDAQFISVNAYGEVIAEDDPYMGFMDGDDELNVEGEHLVLVVAEGGFTAYITASNISKNAFDMTVVNESVSAVLDMHCTQ